LSVVLQISYQQHRQVVLQISYPTTSVVCSGNVTTLIQAVFRGAMSVRYKVLAVAVVQKNLASFANNVSQNTNHTHNQFSAQFYCIILCRQYTQL
jgi:hypothetical protein